MFTYPLTTDQASRINLDEHAANVARRDARELDGEFDLEGHANSLVDQALEDEAKTDDPEEYRARFVKAYTVAFRKERLEKALDGTGIAEAVYDGYTACVVNNTEERDGYRLSIRFGGMFPFFSKDFQSLDKIVAEMATRFPQGAEWASVEPE